MHGLWKRLACPEGIEPPTHSLEGCCSIQLSYGQMRDRRRGAILAFHAAAAPGAVRGTARRRYTATLL